MQVRLLSGTPWCPRQARPFIRVRALGFESPHHDHGEQIREERTRLRIPMGPQGLCFDYTALRLPLHLEEPADVGDGSRFENGRT